eukprot:9372129-Alexandrium_andersonii.AAC.1
MAPERRKRQGDKRMRRSGRVQTTRRADAKGQAREGRRQGLGGQGEEAMTGEQQDWHHEGKKVETEDPERGEEQA